MTSIKTKPPLPYCFSARFLFLRSLSHLRPSLLCLLTARRHLSGGSMTPSPTPHVRQRDEERGSADDGSGSPGDWFDIPPKNAPVERLRRWRVRFSRPTARVLDGPFKSPFAARSWHAMTRRASRLLVRKCYEKLLKWGYQQPRKYIERNGRFVVHELR